MANRYQTSKPAFNGSACLAVVVIGMKHLRIFPALFLALLIGVAACSNVNNAGLTDLIRQAEQGDAEAQYKLGTIYVNGQGVVQNTRKALKWYRLAIDQGHAEAQYTLGTMYSFGGLGLAQDTKEALRYYTLAAEQGHLKAQYNLGGLHYRGKGVPHDTKKALQWYTMAAEQGLAEAQFFLGWMHVKKAMGNLSDADEAIQNEGIQNYKKALKWYRLAAEQKYVKAQFNLGTMYVNGQGIAQDNVLGYMWMNLAVENGGKEFVKTRDYLAKMTMTPQEIEKAQKLSGECKAKNYQNC